MPSFPGHKDPEEAALEFVSAMPFVGTSGKSVPSAVAAPVRKPPSEGSGARTDQGSFIVHGSNGAAVDAGKLATAGWQPPEAKGLCTVFGILVIVLLAEFGWRRLVCLVAPMGFPSSVGSAWRSGIALPEGAGGRAAQFLMG